MYLRMYICMYACMDVRIYIIKMTGSVVSHGQGKYNKSAHSKRATTEGILHKATKPAFVLMKSSLMVVIFIS